jgi:hypothetical protein
VLEADTQNVTTVPDVAEGDTVQFNKYYWNSTVTGITDDTITIIHNPIPDIEFTDIFGKRTEIHFTGSEIIMDHNHMLVGETLVFEVTLVEILQTDGDTFHEEGDNNGSQPHTCREDADIRGDAG